jgi:pteridine reductase
MAADRNDQLMQDQVALVTGGARRIGAALARGFQAAGARVMIHCRGSVAEARELADELNALRRGSAEVVVADITDPGAPSAIVAAVSGRYGRLDVLVNNASTFYPTPIGKVDQRHWDDLVGTNLKAPLFLSQAAADSLRQSGGCIINMVDIHARRPMPDHPVYTAAKAGLAGLTLSLARDLGPKIRVNGIAPGAILWPEGGVDEAARRAILAQTCLGREGSPEDIVQCALYLATAPYVTGQIIAVDGGRSIGW